MKRIASVLMVVLILTVSFKDLVDYTLFQINQDYIAANLCINRTQPKVMCSGKCYFKAVIEENHNPEDDSALMALTIGDQKTIFLDQIDRFKLKVIPEVSLKIQEYTFEAIPDSFLICVFRPPKC